ncbi:hypothetical protein HCN44_007514 [Aphidius gifuensis]|uniref:Nucleolus and neural progenitor protein-like N-terminal domain-containing protein n=1 Tax=Aphidius gifuensis TaxID=684658 RepID=A0A834XJI5_APHGI|nr:hypothetical protein HCN44_007514 [Aphidius gifuensis]
MEALWNKFDLNRPPTNSWRPSPGEFDTTHFICEINKCLKDSSLQNTLHTEAALLSRLIYRMKWKFRNDKGLKKLIVQFDYLKDNIVIDKNNILLPSKQMLDYVLVKIQGFAKLMCKIKSTCMDAAKFFKSKINIGHAWTTSLIAYSVISRLWILSQDYVKQCCDWYRNLYMYRDKLKCVGVNWLPSNYTFPLDLKAWLSVEWEEQNDKCPIKEDLTSSID